MTRLAPKVLLSGSVGSGRRRSGFSYSIETLKNCIGFSARHWNFLYYGSGCLFGNRNLEGLRSIMDYCNLAVVERPGFKWKHGKRLCPLQMVCKQGANQSFQARNGAQLIILNRITHLDLSSTLIREKIGRENPFAFWCRNRASLSQRKEVISSACKHSIKPDFAADHQERKAVDPILVEVAS